LSFLGERILPMSMLAATSDLLTRAELADRLKVGPRTVGRWYQSGRIPGRKLSYKVVRFCLPDVLTALESQQRAAAVSARKGRPRVPSV
jgi:predicted site-specific integrase-resolvase